MPSFSEAFTVGCFAEVLADIVFADLEQVVGSNGGIV
jgi:hypothetical protein